MNYSNALSSIFTGVIKALEDNQGDGKLLGTDVLIINGDMTKTRKPPAVWVEYSSAEFIQAESTYESEMHSVQLVLTGAARDNDPSVARIQSIDLAARARQAIVSTGEDISPCIIDVIPGAHDVAGSYSQNTNVNGSSLLINIKFQTNRY